MRIIFGHNNFVIKRVAPKELGIEDDPHMKNAEIRLIQKFAHLYFIPVFPMGQEWILRKEGKSYVITSDVKAVLHRNYPSRVHIGAFALPLLLILGVIIYSISSKISDYQYQKRAAADLRIKGNGLIKTFDSINNENTAFLSLYDASAYKDLDYAVLKTEGNRLLIKPITENENNKINYSLPSQIRLYTLLKGGGQTEDSIWISKNEIKKTIPNKELFKPISIKGLDPSPLEMRDIYIIKDAYFKNETPVEAESSFYSEYVNYGKDAVIDSLIPTQKGEEWKLSKNKKVNYKERFAIKTESTNPATLYYHTVPDNISHQVKISDRHIKNSISEEY